MNINLLNGDSLVFLLKNKEYLIKNKHIKFINNNKKLLKLHKSILKKYENKYKSIENRETLVGGSMALTLLAATSVSLAIAYFIYKWFRKPRCKKEYPLVGIDSSITFIHLISIIVPDDWVDENYSKEDNIRNCLSRAQVILDHLSVFSGNVSGIAEVGLTVLRFGASIALDVASMGAGADVAISWFCTIHSIFDLVISILNNIIAILLDDDSTRFIYDIFNINFNSGPFGTKCWARYVIARYGSTNVIFSTLCNIFNTILDKLAKFIGNFISACIPNSAGIPLIIVKFIMNNFRLGALEMIEGKINKYYDKIPFEIKVLIKKPKLFEKFLKEKITNFNIENETLNKVINIVIENITFIVTCINKFLALIYSLLQLFMSCVE